MYESENMGRRIENYQGKVSKKWKKKALWYWDKFRQKIKKEKVSLCEKNIRTLKRMIFFKGEEKRKHHHLQTMWNILSWKESDD